jgi:hypothetical protein
VGEAEASLCWLRGWCPAEAVQSELQSLIDNNRTEHKLTPTSTSAYLSKGFVYPFLLVVMSFFIGHFSGMSTLQTYAVSMFIYQ